MQALFHPTVHFPRSGELSRRKCDYLARTSRGIQLILEKDFLGTTARRFLSIIPDIAWGVLIGTSRKCTSFWVVHSSNNTEGNIIRNSCRLEHQENALLFGNTDGEKLNSKQFNRKYPMPVKRLQRRLLIEFMGLIPAVLDTFPVLAAPMPEMKEPEVIRTMKLADGVKFQEIVEGEGTEAHEGDIVEINYVCRRSNGYFVHSTVNQFNGESVPVILPLDDNKIIKGLKEVLIGMRVGGKRRALIPPSVGYINENMEPIPEEFGPRRSLMSHANEPLIFEVQLMKILKQPALSVQGS